MIIFYKMSDTPEMRYCKSDIQQIAFRTVKNGIVVSGSNITFQAAMKL